MGYEIVLKYHPKLEDGSYDRDTIEETKKKIGSPYEDVSPEKLASTIFLHMARRDIFVTDVEIFEFARKKVNFKQSRDGVVIGNRKYTTDDCGQLAFTDTEPPVVPLCSPQQPVTPLPVVPEETAPRQEVLRPTLPSKVSSAHVATQNRAPMRYETFDPNREFPDYQRIKSLPLTPGKRYAIYEEKLGTPGLPGVNYLIIDDRGGTQAINDNHFVPIQRLIQEPDETDRGVSLRSGPSDVSLMFDGEVNDSIGDIRRRR